MTSQDATAFAIDWWKSRHEAPNGYFPTMEQHLNWKLYDEMPAWWMDMAQPTPDDECLEIGCGYGEWMAPLSRRVKRVDGFDIHQSLVDKFNEQLSGIENASMVLGDGSGIPFPDKWFSLVYSISVFQHMPRAIVHGYLHETARVMKPDGRAVLHFRHADGKGPYSDDIAVNHTGDWSVGWTLKEVTKACTAVGLKIVRHMEGQSLIVRAEHK